MNNNSEDDNMKKFLCIILALATILTFASCTKLPDSTQEMGEPITTAKPPKVKEITKNAEIKDASGRVVFTVEVTYPEISKNAEPSVIDYVNRVTAEIFEKACEFAENNKNNAAASMDSSGTDVPWTKKIKFESTYLSGRYVCFLIGEVFSSSGNADSFEPTLSTLCFDIVKGLPCDVMYFAADSGMDFYAMRDTVTDLVRERALYDFYPNGVGLANKQLEMFPDYFDVENFYITEEGMGFHMERYNLDSTLTGSYRCVIPWSELEGLFIHPETVA